MCNESLLLEEADAARTELYDFAVSTVRAVMDIENKRRKTNSSSLQVFCRLDVSVIKKGDGSYCYFVNELERSLTVGLYRRCTGSHGQSMLKNAVDHIPRYLRSLNTRR